ncbi:hypothetical protein ACGF0D_10605 [Kitasatospora sp. NPDC048298]|uniref:hypothetical protein n=1 Tax=Kitasatospora sp. NPDC048298 TaxID=3364049 RepID=UPI0037103465
MTSAYQQQLAQQLRAAEDELGTLRRRVAELTEQRDTTRAGGQERAALLEHARDPLEPWGGHGDAWPDIAPAINTLIARAEQAEARIAAVRALHQPATGYTGWGPDDDDTPGAYGPISQACSACGSEDNAVRYPCGTIRALDTHTV